MDMATDYVAVTDPPEIAYVGGKCVYIWND